MLVRHDDMRSLVRGVVGLTGGCLALRLAAWLIEPVIPLLVVLSVVLGLLSLAVGRRGLS